MTSLKNYMFIDDVYVVIQFWYIFFLFSFDPFQIFEVSENIFDIDLFSIVGTNISVFQNNVI